MGDHFKVLWLFNKGWRGVVDLATHQTRPRSHECTEALTPGGPECWRSPSHRMGALVVARREPWPFLGLQD